MRVLEPRLCVDYDGNGFPSPFDATVVMCTMPRNGAPGRFAPGDSGGPALIGSTLVGIVSYHSRKVDNVGYEIQVGAFLPWIKGLQMADAE